MVHTIKYVLLGLTTGQLIVLAAMPDPISRGKVIAALVMIILTAVFTFLEDHPIK